MFTIDEAPMFDEAQAFDAAKLEADNSVDDSMASSTDVQTIANAFISHANCGCSAFCVTGNSVDAV